MIIRRYELTPHDGQGETLLACLEALATSLMRREGCLRVEIDRGLGDSQLTTFSEYWLDEESRLAAGLEINRDLLRRIFASSALIGDRKSVRLRAFERPAEMAAAA